MLRYELIQSNIQHKLDIAISFDVSIKTHFIIPICAIFSKSSSYNNCDTFSNCNNQIVEIGMHLAIVEDNICFSKVQRS